MAVSSTNIPEFISQCYATKDVEKIIEKKSAGLQVRAITSNQPVKVDMSPDECKKLCKTSGVAYYPGYEARVLQYTMSDETVDRYGDIVKADGANLANYKKNAVIMTFHDYKQFPVGACIKVWIDKEAKAVKGWVLIVDGQVDPTGISDTAFRFASSGYMKAGSVGFMPEETYRPTTEEKTSLGMGEYGLVFKKWELMEFSLCGVPANPNAVQNSINSTVQRGIIQQKDIEVLRKNLPEDEFSEFINIVEKFVQAKENETVGTKAQDPAEVQAQTTVSSPVISMSVDELNKLVAGQLSIALKEFVVTTQRSEPIQKAGAMISKKNKELIGTAITQMSDAVTALQALLAGADNSTDETTQTDSLTNLTEEGKDAGDADQYDVDKLDAVLAEFSKSIQNI